MFLNKLWGKLCQKPPRERECFVYGYRQYVGLIKNGAINQATLSFRHMSGDMYKARYQMVVGGVETSSFINIPIAASVTAHAQVILMRKMFEVGPENMLYCDTDSVMYLRQRGLPELHKEGLGNWTDEHLNSELTRWWALAPKSYLIEEEEHDGSVQDHLKYKGVKNTVENRVLVSKEVLHRLVEARFLDKQTADVKAKTMTIYANSTNSEVPYGTLMTRYGEKIVQAVYSKRQLLVNNDPEIQQLDQMALIRLVPFGYTGDLDNRRREVL
jgi:DNA polymerase elongation subunit (family B)